MAWASWWNRHLACFIPRHLGGTGILPVSGLGHLSGTGILPVSFPSRHLACFISEQASCLFPASGILVEQASCLFHFRTGILPVTIPRQAGCPPHSYSSEDSAMRTKLKLCIIY
ncbi:hypothetical protein [Moorena sp. SIO4A5]|uniref:hypothetical protein n=1 Tax=Moorena sp. SIO4A5 TaxID=2607838 RepID=UPI0013CD768B|nr:hypothetical protein [Moorena sp. SIO4A5]NEO19419.1 hypothetical protein [Moorena sp. SIO4A5]